MRGAQGGRIMARTHPFLERLGRGPILCDGAMGTQLYERGIPYDRCFDALNLSDPELIKAIHLDYIAAGAEIIETNTFGANRFRLAEHDLSGEVSAINRAGAKIAREARDLSEQQVFLAGSIGPIGRPLEPLGSVDIASASAAFREQAEALLQTGVDLFILETISDLVEMRAALVAIRGVTDLPVVAQMTFNPDGLTSTGDDPAAAARTMREYGADVVGVNCALGPADTLDAILEMRDADGLVRLAAQPNAGLPTRVGSRFIYITTPEYFSDYTRRFLAAGVSLIGGCCGTTPAHIAAMAATLRVEAPQAARAASPPRPVRVEVAQEHTDAEATPSYPTALAACFGGGRFAISAEMRPPRGIKSTRFLQNAALLGAAGVDTINITDNAMAHVRMSNLAAARLIQEGAGVETIVHFTPRDRNLMAVQGDLIGAHASGLRNILAVTGDPPSSGDYPSATGIWDVDSVGLVAILANLNRGMDGAGRKLGSPAAFYIGCAATPTATDIDLDLDRLHRKVAAGAQFVMTQPVYEARTLFGYLDRYRERYGPLGIPIMIGLQPLQSYRLAEKFHNEVPGIVIPEAVLQRMRRAGDRGFEEGLAIARELAEEICPRVQGAYIMALDRYDLVGELIPHIRACTQAMAAVVAGA